MSILLHHHHGKVKTKGARGHSNLGGDSDTMIQVLRNSKTNPKITLKCERTRSAANFKDIHLLLTDYTLEDGHEDLIVTEDTGIKVHKSIATPKGPSFEALKRLYVLGGHTNLELWADNIQKRTFRNHIKTLIDDKFVIKRGDGSYKITLSGESILKI